MDWQGSIRRLLEDQTAKVFGADWSILPEGATEPIAIERAVFDDFVATSREEETETVATYETAKILEVQKSQGLRVEDLPGGTSSVFGTATRVADNTVFSIVAVREDLTNIFLYLAGPQNV